MTCLQSHPGFELGHQAQGLGSCLLHPQAFQAVNRQDSNTLHHLFLLPVTSLPYFAWQILANATFSREPHLSVGRSTLALCSPRASLLPGESSFVHSLPQVLGLRAPPNPSYP